MSNIRIPATEPRIVIEFYNLASVSLQVDLTRVSCHASNLNFVHPLPI